ncbi:MAG: GntR family transcriptional regulator [Pseudomonadota bacterium]
MAENKSGKNKGVDQVQTAYLEIRNLMFHNEIVPGQKLSYRELAERLGMSQTPVIQALKWIEFQNLVYREPHRGYFTAPVSIREVEEIYGLRELIETSLLPETIRLLTPEKLQVLEAAMNSHIQASREPHIHARLVRDMEFHLVLADLSEREVHRQTLSHLFDRLYLKYGANILFAASMKQADNDHQRLFEKIAGHDVRGARKTLVCHIQRVKKHVLEGLEKIKQSREQDLVRI